MTDLDAQRDFEEAGADDPAAAMRAHTEAAAVDMHTSGPGIIQSFDGSKQTAVVAPVIEKWFRGKGFKPLPPIVDVSVQFPGGGGFVLTFPVAQGDECLLVFSERAIDNWWQTGKVSPPSDSRIHSLSDSFAILGIRSLPKVVQNFNATAVELRSLNGAAKVQIASGGAISIESPGNVVIKSTGTVSLNAPPGATSLMNGVLMGSHPCPFTGLPHSSSGPPSSKVLVGP